MRTTIRIDDDLLKDAQREAAASGKTFTQLVTEALREKIARRRTSVKRTRVVLPTFDGNGLQPGVDLHNSAALLALMEEHDAAGRR